MAKAHLVIGRSGAGTVAELMVIGRPAILVPLPHALDDNQTPNADVLADAGAGWRVAQSDLTPKKLADMLRDGFRLARRSCEARRGGACAGESRTRHSVLPISSTGSGAHDGAACSPTRVPFDIGTIHFIGIGGIGMSGIAEIMHNLGYQGAGLRCGRQRQCEAAARARHSRRRRPCAGQSQ